MRVIPDSDLSSKVTITAPTQKKTVHNVFLIDASGSMAGSKYETAISGVNQLLANIKEDTFTNNTLTIVEFEERRIENMLYMVTNFPANYKGGGTGGMTPLNEAIGVTCETIRADRKKKFSTEDKVLVNVFTDGGENHSRGKYASKDVLATYIKELESDGFTITFQGTQAEVNYAINSLHLSASNTNVHDNTARGIADSFLRTASARTLYSKSVSNNEVVTSNFYTKTLSNESDKS